MTDDVLTTRGGSEDGIVRVWKNRFDLLQTSVVHAIANVQQIRTIQPNVFVQIKKNNNI